MTKKTTIKVSPVYSRNMNDIYVPGVQVVLSREEAESYGVFEETALSEEEAWESNVTDISNIDMFLDAEDEA
ncbi:conjugal transfer protein TraD [Bartonella sp. C271]|uniref:conjugal transfer protein TraD n=1 Tax=Bartonella sp. C271 TaxID=3070220 RepID=UPI0038B54067